MVPYHRARDSGDVGRLEWAKAALLVAGSLLSLHHCILGGAFMFMHMEAAAAWGSAAAAAGGVPAA